MLSWSGHAWGGDWVAPKGGIWLDCWLLGCHPGTCQPFHAAHHPRGLAARYMACLSKALSFASPDIRQDRATSNQCCALRPPPEPGSDEAASYGLPVASCHSHTSVLLYALPAGPCQMLSRQQHVLQDLKAQRSGYRWSGPRCKFGISHHACHMRQ